MRAWWSVALLIAMTGCGAANPHIARTSVPERQPVTERADDTDQARASKQPRPAGVESFGTAYDTPHDPYGGLTPTRVGSAVPLGLSGQISPTTGME